MLPGVKPAKSSASHPLVELLGSGPGGRTRSTPWTAAVTSPLPEYSIVAKPFPARVSSYSYATNVGVICSSSGCSSSWKNGNTNGWIVTS